MLRTSFLALALLFTACRPAAPPSFVATARTAPRLEVRPGTPRGEPAPLEGVVRLHGETFYDRFVDLADEDRKQVASLVSSSATYAAHVEGKKCGGFHADYAVEWKQDGHPYRVLLCFGCHEALSLSDGEERLNDLSEAGYQGLVRILNRANRD